MKKKVVEKSLIDKEIRAKTVLRKPPYHSVLNRCFPYKKTVTRMEALAYSLALLKESEQTFTEDGSAVRLVEDAGGLWFAVTGHPYSVNGSVTLWLSIPAVRFLRSQGYIDEVEVPSI